MGCASSRHEQRCRHCRSPYSPVRRRSYSLRTHHPPPSSGDVGLPSSTLGSVKLDSSINGIHNDCEAISGESRNKEFSVGLIEAKTWSSMIEEKVLKIVPKTPTITPPGEPEAIDAWELMEGLEDTTPLRPLNHERSFSFHLLPKDVSVSLSVSVPPPKSPLKPFWLQIADDDDDNKSSPDPNLKSIMSDFDPDIISTFRKALAELSPANLSPVKSFPRRLGDACDVFDEMWKTSGDANFARRALQQRHKVVVYFTSLRGVRKTHDDCCDVRTILKGSGFRVDERDVSMHSGFKEELKELLGDGFALPSVFAGGKHVGGVEEVRRMCEEGELEKVLGGCEMAGEGDGVCEGCGDVRFVPCESCSGSCKVYCYDCEDEDRGGGDADEALNGFKRCPDCNENGIRRCPICCL